MGSFANVLYSYLTDYIKILLVLWGIMNFHLIKSKKYYLVSGIIQGIIIVVLAGYYRDNTDVAAICATFLVIISVSFIFEGKYFKVLAYALLAYILVLFLDACIAGICSILYIETENLFAHFIFNTINVVSLGIIVAIKKSTKKVALQVRISKRIYALLFAGAGTGVLTVAGLAIEANSKSAETARKIITVITIIVVICYCSACIMMVFITESRDNYKSLSIINQRVIESQQQYYTLVNDKQQEIRSLRHEMKNHLTCINGLYKANKLAEMEQYINQVIDASDETVNLLDTGNDIVNAILNDAQSRYQKEAILIRLEGGFPLQLQIAPMDLCVIMANVISNAVEAIQRMERKENEISYVDVKISSFKNDLYIDVKNPVDHNIKISTNGLVTSKKDKNLHGFGVRNVIQRVEKYQGTYEYKIENSQFWVEITMING